MPLPDFVIIGAMKCGTSTLQTQLAAQPGVFMSTPKEPNFFSDDDVHARGLGWYEGLFAAARPGDIKGEASTHYTKLPTYPRCVERFAAVLPEAKLIYMTRDPFARLVSHYIHEWTMGVIRCDLETALERHPELVAYSRYGMQIAPWVARFGADRIHHLTLERMNADPDGEFARVGAFLGLPRPAVWDRDIREQNVSAERIRRFPLYDLIVDHPAAAALRRALVPRALRDAVKGRLQMRERPTLSEAARARLAPVFAEDAAELDRLLATPARA